jgi:hypothetical protein
MSSPWHTRTGSTQNPEIAARRPHIEYEGLLLSAPEPLCLPKEHKQRPRFRTYKMVIDTTAASASWRYAVGSSGSQGTQTNVDTTEAIQELLPSTPKHRQTPSHVRISHLDENSAIVFKQWLTLDRPGVKICCEQAKGSDVVMRHISIKDG